MFVVSRTFGAYYVHETEEIYKATKLNLAKLTKEPSATYQIRLPWPQRGTKVNRPHPAAFTTMVRKNISCSVYYHGSETYIVLRSPPWFGNRYDKFKHTRATPSAVHTQHEEHNERTEHTAVAG